MEDLVADLQAAVTTVDANMLKCVGENAEGRTPSALKWPEVAVTRYAILVA